MNPLSFIELIDHDAGSWVGLYALIFLAWVMLKALGFFKR